ncbi:hypothetical protein [Anaeromyxobacter diazotrophicus]|nr:hypothetical protein [Anaeromyxobacter diazotrophicus]
MKAFAAALQATALALWAAPALALAQAGAQPGSAPAPINDPTSRQAGGSGWLWIIAALVVLAIIWWAMSSRRRHGPATR